MERLFKLNDGTVVSVEEYITKIKREPDGDKRVVMMVKDGLVASFQTTPEYDIAVSPLSVEELKILSQRDILTIVSLSLRPNVGKFFQNLEETHYPPNTPTNQLYEFYVLSWEEVRWYVAMIPMNDWDKAQAEAKNLGFKLADGVPTMFSGDGAVHFPLDGQYVYTIEGEYKPDQVTII